MRRIRGKNLEIKKIAISTVILSLIGFGIYILFFSRFFLLRKVECNGCSDIMMAELTKDIGKNIFKIKPPKIGDKLLQSDLTLAEVKVKIKLPNTLMADVKKRIPYFRLANDVSSLDYLLADSQGVILDKVKRDENNNLPILIWPEILELNIGARIPERIVKGAEILDLLRQNYDVAERGKIENNGLSIKIINGPLIKFNLDKEVIAQIRSLQFTLNQVKIDLLSPKEIDLRFNNPIVVN